MDSNVPKRVTYAFSEPPTKQTQEAPIVAPSIAHVEQHKVKYGFSKTPKAPVSIAQVPQSQVKYGFLKTPSVQESIAQVPQSQVKYAFSKPPNVPVSIVQVSKGQVKYGFSKTPQVQVSIVQVSKGQVKYGFSKTPQVPENTKVTPPSQVKYGFLKTPNVQESNVQVSKGQVKYGFQTSNTQVAKTKKTNKVNYVKKETKTETCRPTVEDDAQTFCVEPVRENPSQPRKRKLKDVGQQDDGHEKRRDRGHKVDQEGEQKKEECLDNIQAMAIQLALKKSVLILGEGGTGKSFLFERLMRDLGNKLMVVKTAPTGSAALRIGGKTVHSWAGVARADKDVQDLVRFVKRSRWATARWKDVDVLILDEISMVSAELLDKLDQVGRAIRKNDAPFGGIRVVASGDFLQLQPVNGEFCFGAACFDDLFPEDSRVVLTRNFRQANDKLFRRILTNMRAGSLTDEDIQALQSRVGAERSGQALYVYATNAEVNHMNTAKLAATTGTSRAFKDEFVQFHSMSADDAARLEAELSNAPCVEMLKLKICARVMLIVNKKFPKCSPKVNGSTGMVTNFDAQGNPEVRFDDGDVCTVMKHSWFTSCKKMSRTQYPLVLAWAVTIHKMQGATIPNATLILNLGSHIFSPCQAYVALSRACSLDQVVLEDFDASSVRSNPEAIAFCSACLQAQQERLADSNKASQKN